MFQARHVSKIRTAFAACAFLMSSSGVSSSQDAVVPACPVHAEFSQMGAPLYRTAYKITTNAPLRIMAIGSSSTFGAYASNPGAAYPAQLEIVLHGMFPGQNITVLNRGVNGEEAADMRKRIEESLLDEKPDLVIYQAGTNAVLKNMPLAPVIAEMDATVKRLRDASIDVIILNSQYVEHIIDKPGSAAMLQAVQNIADERRVPLFNRYDLMRRWRDADGIAFSQFSAHDGIHHNDWSYGCLAQNLAVAIGTGATGGRTTGFRP